MAIYLYAGHCDTAEPDGFLVDIGCMVDTQAQWELLCLLCRWDPASLPLPTQWSAAECARRYRAVEQAIEISADRTLFAQTALHHDPDGADRRDIQPVLESLATLLDHVMTSSSSSQHECVLKIAR